MRKQIIIIILILFFFSCEKKIDIPLYPTGNKYLVVNGIITNENIPKTIKLTYSVENLNEKPETVSGAQVYISNEDTTYTLHEDSVEKGLYITNKSFYGVINKTYNLKIILDNKEYFAQAQMLPVSLFQNASYYFNETENLYEISYVATNFSTEEAAMWKLSLDWSFIEGYSDLPYEENHAELYFYTLTTIDVNEIFAPPQEKVFFPKGTLITEKKYSLSSKHEKFIRSVLMETQWAGSIFELSEGNVYTNLSEGALGFFGASSVITSSFIAE